MKLFTAFLLALLFTFSGLRPASAVVIPNAWTGYCEGCDNGNVVLDFDGEQRAVVFNLQYDADADKYVGYGSIEYTGQGVSVNDAAGYFMVSLVDSPTKDLPLCKGSSKMVSSVDIIGKGYRLSTADFRMDLSNPCAQGRYTLNLDVKSNQFKKVSKPSHLKRTLSGRMIAQ